MAVVITDSNFWKEMRIKSGYSQGQIALKLGYTSSQLVSNWERNLCNPPRKDISKLIELYEINVDEYIRILLDQQRKEIEEYFSLDIGRAVNG